MTTQPGNDPFANIIERDLAEKCSADAADVLSRAFQLCETQRGCVVVGVAGVAGAMASCLGAFYAAYEGELTEEIVDAFWRDLMRGVVLETVAHTAGAVSRARANAAGKPTS